MTLTRMKFRGLPILLLMISTAGSASAQWITLFDGTSLNGWQQAGPGYFSLETDGTLLSNGGMGLFYYESESFRDFELELEWKTSNPTANSGIFLRFPETDDPWVAVNEGYEIQIDDSRDPHHVTASVFALSPPFRVNARPTGEWNDYRIRVTGQRYEVWLNGEKVNDFMGDRSREGHIGLQNHDDSSRVSFRNIRVRPLEMPAAESIAQLFATPDSSEEIRVLMVTATHAFRHGPAIDAQKEVMLALSETTELKVDTTEDLTQLNPDNLARYDVLFLANATLRAPHLEGMPETKEPLVEWGTFDNFEIELLIPDNRITGTIALNGEPRALSGYIKFNLFPAPSTLQDIVYTADSLLLNWDTGGMGMANLALRAEGDTLTGTMTLTNNQIPAKVVRSTPPATEYNIDVHSPQGSITAVLSLAGPESTIEFPEAILPVEDLVQESGRITFSFNAGEFGEFKASGAIDSTAISGTFESGFGTIQFAGNEVDAASGEEHKGPTVTEDQMAAIMDFLGQGKGLAIAHAGLDAFYNWDTYREMVGGGLFDSHPWTQSVRIQVEDATNPAVSHFGDDFWIRDEIYVLDANPRWNARVLLSLDTKSVELTGAAAGDERNDYPMSWIRNHNDGRVFVTKLGHFADVWKTPDFIEHVLQGLRLAAGRLDADYSGHRLKEVIAEDVWPDDIAVDERGDVWIAELRGKVHHYSDADGQLRQIAQIETTNPTNVEHGLYGIEVDPNFYNGAPYVYLYYAEPNTFINTLSRFMYVDGMLDLDSEHVLLRVPTEPQCCHQGGDLEWGTDSTLFLSTGDTGMSEVRPGWKLTQEQLDQFMEIHDLKDYHWSRLVDSERSAQNLQDLRGKILRINRDGSIPQDNPFFGSPGVRWEIYAYGLRNPYRFKQDHDSGALYIGVVGPDASFDYDEYDVSAKGGENFGWPRTLGRLFYNEWTPEMIPNFVPPFWEYTYEHGGRSAAVGPIYRSDGPYAFPASLQGRLFVYDWARRWIKYGEIVDSTFTSDMEEDARQSSPAIQLPAKRLVNIKMFDTLRQTAPISMELGPDGSLYVAEFDGFWDAGPRARVTRYRWINRKTTQ